MVHEKKFVNLSLKEIKLLKKPVIENGAELIVVFRLKNWEIRNWESSGNIYFQIRGMKDKQVTKWIFFMYDKNVRIGKEIAKVVGIFLSDVVQKVRP